MLLLQFLSAPEDGCKKRPKHVSINAVTNRHTAKLHHVGSLYILTYDARKLKHKVYFEIGKKKMSDLRDERTEGDTTTLINWRVSYF